MENPTKAYLNICEGIRDQIEAASKFAKVLEKNIKKLSKEEQDIVLLKLKQSEVQINQIANGVQF